MYTIHTAGCTVYFSSLFFVGVIAVILLGGVAFLVGIGYTINKVLAYILVKRRKTGTAAAAGGTEMGVARPKVDREGRLSKIGGHHAAAFEMGSTDG